MKSINQLPASKKLKVQIHWIWLNLPAKERDKIISNLSDIIQDLLFEFLIELYGKTKKGTAKCLSVKTAGRIIKRLENVWAGKLV